MTRLDNTDERYGTIAIAFHWLVAILIVGLLALGLYMVRLPDVGFDKRKITLVLWHKEYGMLVLVLAFARVVWRVRAVLPRLEPALPDWQKIAARFVHLCMYALMFALPLTGWLMSSADAIPVSFFGLGFLPDLVPKDDFLFRALLKIHRWLAYTMMAALAAHAGAALWHHFGEGDETLRRMLP